MYKLYFSLAIVTVLFSACSKRDYYVPNDLNEQEWMQTHERGVVAYVDFYTGNYIIETTRGFSVMEAWGGVQPREYDEEYAFFSNRGVQSIYNYTGNFFTEARVVDSWLSWSDALYVLDQISYQ